MLIAEISAMVQGDTYTYRTDDNGDVYLLQKHRVVPPNDGLEFHEEKHSPGAGGVMITLVRAPVGSYTVVDCRGYSSYTTQTFTDPKANTEDHHGDIP